MKREPVFIVGAQRSGTTLLAAQLAAHSRMSCGPETHFFRWLAEIDDETLYQSDSWPDSALSFIESITYTSYSEEGKRLLIAKYQVSKNEVRTYLEDHEPSVAAMLSSIIEPHMHRLGKQRWVEKTPEHLCHLELIRKHFPASPIIRIVRDPRDVALSSLRVPWGVKSLVEGLLLWKSHDDASADFFDHDSCSYTIRYEDLLISPRETLAGICHFLQEPFEESMLDTSSTATEVNSRNVPWKAKVGEPIDRDRLEVWRRSLNDAENELAESLLGDRIQKYGYALTTTFDTLGKIFPTAKAAEKYPQQLSIVAKQGVRFWKTHGAEQPSATVYLGDPGEISWLGCSSLNRTLNTVTLASRITREIIRRTALYWIPAHRPPKKWTGSHAFVLKNLLSPYVILDVNDPAST